MQSKMFARVCSTLLVTILLTRPFALAQDYKSLVDQANAAYEHKDFAASGQLFVKAIQAGAGAITNHYNAACAFSLGGDFDRAFEHLQASIDAGLDGSSSLKADSDFTPLHGDPRWNPLVERFAAANPSAALLDLLRDNKRSTASRYFAGRRGLIDGVVSTDKQSSQFNQLYANMAQFVGEYDEASKVYGYPKAEGDPVALGYTHASAGNAVILERSRDRQAVFLNESHGQSQTRAANYTLLAPLRAQGFKYLAIETLSTTDYMPPADGRCADSTLFDGELAARGYAINATGHYTQDPVFAEIIREALRLGYLLIAYDTYIPGQTVPIREEKLARNLACVFKADPKAKLVVLAGFSHIAEGKDFWVPGGAMAYRFKAMTGIDPLSVDTTTQLSLAPDRLVFDDRASLRSAGSYVLKNASGDAYGTENFDLVVFVPGPAHRNDPGGSWLELGGARKTTAVTAGQCKGRFPCMIEARRAGEQPDAIASDRCVIASSSTKCSLYLAFGNYTIAAFDEQEKRIDSVARTVE